VSRKSPKDPHFPGMPPIARLHRPWVLTEKIDGTNGLIAIRDLSSFTNDPEDPATHWPAPLNFMTQARIESDFGIWAGSKNQWLGPDGDNFGFGAWVSAHADALIGVLGEGLHRGEWWGSGIQTGYGLPKGEKRFSLFNTSRWAQDDDLRLATVPGLGVVPVMHSGVDGHELNLHVHAALRLLEIGGSLAAPGFDRPEGVVAFQPSSQITYKATIRNDEVPKSLVRNG
jgi:hypothetical protein